MDSTKAEILRQLRWHPGERVEARLGAISDGFNGQDYELFAVFGGLAAAAAELRRERDEARTALTEWEARTPNRLRLKADMLEEAIV